MITQEELKLAMSYDGDTGVFTWIAKRNGVKVGSSAGHVHCKGHSRKYHRITFKGKMYYRSRLAWFYTYGEWPDEIDHKNSNSLDDRIENLESSNRVSNMRNQKLHSTNKSGVSGVHFDKSLNRWRGHK